MNIIHEVQRKGRVKVSDSYFYGTIPHNINDQPAYIKYYENGNKMIEKWYSHGLLHRENAPAVISYYESGNIKLHEYYRKDQNSNDFYFYREDGPTVVEYHDNRTNSIKEEIYYEGEGKYTPFNNIMPTLKKYNSAGDYIEELYVYMDGRKIKYYYKDNTCICELYMYNNKLHREDGPAKIEYDDNGNVKKLYFLYDRQISNERFEWCLYNNIQPFLDIDTMNINRIKSCREITDDDLIAEFIMKFL